MVGRAKKSPPHMSSVLQYTVLKGITRPGARHTTFMPNMPGRPTRSGRWGGEGEPEQDVS